MGEMLMLSDERFSEIKTALSEASCAPWRWSYSQGETPTDDPHLLRIGIGTIPTAPSNMQLTAGGKHRFWIELSETRIPDIVRDLDFISGAREWIPDLVAEIERLRGLLGEQSP
jgi:hypothetical protein